MELEPIARDSAPAHGRYIPTTANTAPATTKSTIVAIARSAIPASAAPAISGAALLCSALVCAADGTVARLLCAAADTFGREARAKPERLLHTCCKSPIRARCCFRRQDKT